MTTALEHESPPAAMLARSASMKPPRLPGPSRENLEMAEMELINASGSLHDMPFEATVPSTARVGFVIG